MRAGPQQDALAIAQNGGVSATDVDDGDLDGDAEVDMDDDMMDKISSSPSIEDGALTLALSSLSPSAPGTPPQLAARRTPSPTPDVGDPRSSSPYLESPDWLPLRERGRTGGCQRAAVRFSFGPSMRRHHHLNGEFATNDAVNDDDDDGDDASSSTHSLPDGLDSDDSTLWEGRDGDGEDERDSILLEDLNSGNGPAIHGSVGLGMGLGRGDHDRAQGNDSNPDLTIPYESDADDDGDFPELSDSRFIDSGWGGECLQDTEDIDFDFVYALHTFVATVEGQANATKGDTMVLLDDSNSYWWLVRVVKDSSIGKPLMATTHNIRR